MFRFTRPSITELKTLLENARRAEPTYADVGATRDSELRIAGYRHVELIRTIDASSAFELARDGLRTWQAQIGAGADVYPRTFGPGETVIVQMRMGPLFMLAPCRLVYVIDEPERFGFAYGPCLVIQRRVKRHSWRNVGMLLRSGSSSAYSLALQIRS